MDRVRHKGSNRFKFQSFAERISNINVDVYHHIPHRYEEDDDERSTYFYQSVQKWCTLNLTENFRMFRHEIGCEISTLPQLINNKEKIISVFLNHIKLQSALSLKPVLEMLVAFVKDIRYEFYQFYPQILRELIVLLKMKDPEVLESTFICLAYIFKYLARELVKDLDKVLIDLTPLLDDNNPPYVRDFAAQSFAFVARKVKDKEKFLHLILQTVQSLPHLLDGSSQLIFHMLCGIKGQSHSCAEELLYTIFNGFGSNSLPQKLLFDLTNNIVTLYGNAIGPQYSVLFPVLKKVLNEKLEKEDNSKSIEKLLKIVRISLQCRSGASLPDSLIQEVTSCVTKLVSSSDNKISKISAEICGEVLTLDKLKIPQEIASLIIIKVIDTKKEEILLDFMQKVYNFSGFETLVLPQALQVLCSFESQAFLRDLAKIISKKIEGENQNYDVLHLPVYKIILKNSSLKVKDMILEIIENFNPSSDLNNLLHALIIIRHISPVDRKQCAKVLLGVIEKIIKNRNYDIIGKEKLLFVLCSSFESLLYFKDSVDSENFDRAITSGVLQIMSKNKSIVVLRIVNLYLKIFGNIRIDDDGLFLETYKNVEEMNQSAHSYFRFLALDTLQNLERIRTDDDGTKKSLLDILSLCIGVETVPLTISDYREKIKELQKLRYESLPSLRDEHYQVIIKYLLGILFCNFKLLWEPIFEVLATHGQKLPKIFWNIFFKQLCYATDVCKGRKSQDDVSLPDFDEYLLHSVRFVKVNDKADYKNYRYLLWKSMNLFVDLCESKNRDIVPLYLAFLREELLRSSSHHNLTINIKQNENEEEGDEDTNEKTDLSKTDDLEYKSASSSVIKWAVAHLTLLSNFKSPKLCYKESEVRNSYYDLLEHKNSEIQKLALECLLTYNFKYMVPYKQNLRNLVDDVKFKDEIIHFQIDKESGVIKENDRAELMPVVMRILYNKMLSRSATKRGSKGSAAALKRSLVFRFLAGCSDSEMQVFLNMAFRTFSGHQEADSEDYLKTMSSVDLEHVTPPKKLLSVVHLIDVIIENFGGLMTVCIQRYILKILFSVGAITSGIFAQREKVFSGFMTALKNLRSLSVDCLCKFFDRLSYPWSEDDINSVFEIFIWTGLEKLPVEGLYNPTGVLKIFSKWSENPRYHILFARLKKDDTTISPLPYIMKLLLNEKVQNSVTVVILEIIEHLLILKEEVMEETLGEMPLTISHLIPVDEAELKKLTLKEELNYGSQILLPHVSSILTYLRRKLERSSHILQKSELTILSRVTELATSPENADSLMTIILRLLTVKKPTDEEVLMNTMLTVENLSKIVNKPLLYVKSFAVLLNNTETPESRRSLITSLVNIQTRCPEIEVCVNIIKDLNANDTKHIGQPDFDKRIDAYKQVHSLAGSGNMDLNFALMVLHNCFYVIRCDTDLSLRDSSSHCLREICPLLANSWKDLKSQNQFWIDTILRLIHKAIIGNDENIQYFAISLLGVMARECSDLHPVLKDLSVYSNKADLEVDFFENSIHLQSHRRVRALLRFSSLSKTLIKAPNSRSLVQFILPLATRYLCNEKYLVKNAVIDAAISCLGSVCKFLPWPKYQTILRYYLSKFHGKIEYQRQLVRIIITILDSFHFDISKAKEAAGSQVLVNANADISIDEKVMSKDGIGEDIKEGEVELLENLHDDDVCEQEEDVCDEGEKLEKNVPEKTTLAYTAITVLNPNEAAKVERAISGPLLTQLSKAIGQKSQIEDTHKTNIKSLGPEKDQEDVMRIPIAVTLVKLLQNLSTKMLEDHLPGILMRLCTFLKSKMESVRRTSRETLQQIMKSLGPKYLNVILSEMTSALTKGFQLHVLIFTIHSVIQAIQDQLKPGNIDENIVALIEICKTDIFGQPSEEKDVKQIQVKHKEVRSTKSYRLMNLIAQYATERCLTDVLMPIKEVLSTSNSHKTISKCRECLRHVVLGLCANEFISGENLFIYSYGVTSECIPKLTVQQQVQEKKKNPKERRDCFLIPEEPKSRTGVLSNPVKKDPNANYYILLEFGFQLLQFLLKKEKLRLTPNYKSLLDPHGPVLVKAIQSQHVKVSTLALNCLCKIFKYDLPSLRPELNFIVSELFAILHKYAAPGLPKGETFDLVSASFKAICMIIRDTKYNEMDTEKLKMLLVYVEQDIYDNNRQASAFNLLKTILKKNLNVPELNDLMKKVAELSVSSELAHVRLQARQSAFQYIMDYPLGQKLEYFIGFYISQLSFSLESGRQSALEMINSFITHFPEHVLNKQCGVFFITLGARLINDNNPDCRKAVSSIVKSMLIRLKNECRTQLFDIICLWLKQNKLNHRRLAAQIAGIFVSLEKTDFEVRLPTLLPLIQLQFTGNSKPGKYVKLPKGGESEEQGKDYHIFQVLQLLLKICTHCPLFLKKPEHQESIHFFIEVCQSLLCHPHEWVRLAAIQFLGCVFNSIEPVEVAKVLNGEKIESNLSFLEESSLLRRIRSLILDHTSQLIPGVEIRQELIEQVTKNLVYFARVLKDLKETETEVVKKDEEDVKDEDDEDLNTSVKKISMLWLIRRLRGIINKEIAEAPLSYLLRTGIFKWIGAVAVCFTKEELLRILYHLIAPVVRERDLVEGESSQSPIKSLVIEVTKVLKQKVGVEEFTKEAVKVQKKLLERRRERRMQRAQEFVTNPERAAKRKIEKQAKKKMLKKRKIQAYKGRGIKRKAESDDFV